jgi:hypothetical protein
MLLSASNLLYVHSKLPESNTPAAVLLFYWFIQTRGDTYWLILCWAHFSLERAASCRDLVVCDHPSTKTKHRKCNFTIWFIFNMWRKITVVFLRKNFTCKFFKKFNIFLENQTRKKFYSSLYWALGFIFLFTVGGLTT